MSSDGYAMLRPGGPDAGWEASLVAMYLTEYKSLVRLAMLIVHDIPTAEDVVQTSFLRVMSARPALHTSGAELSYVRQAVVNTARSALRDRGPVLYLAELEPRVNVAIPSAESRVVEDSEREALMDVPYGSSPAARGTRLRSRWRDTSQRRLPRPSAWNRTLRR